ncbi:MAG: BrnA antitoxin family protein [Selenomonadaceae bacterium]|nr:BrnA antitoxin family protein [Selenomonadaceae bacterium]
MAMHKMFVKEGQKPTEEQRERIRQAAAMPITYDEDCPELTEEQYKEFARIAAAQRAERKKQLVSLRLSPDTLAKAKKLGRGYTGVLSRLLDLAINDPAMVSKCL